MSNRRNLRPSICRALTPDGRPLTRQPRFRDPGTSVPTPPHRVRTRPEPVRNPRREVKPMSYTRRDESYWPKLTGRQARRIFKKYWHAKRREEASKS